MLTRRCAQVSYIALLFILLFAPPLFAREKIAVTLLLNGEERGEFFVMLADDKDILLLADDIRGMGIKEAVYGKEAVRETVIDEQHYISLRSLSSFGITFDLNERESTLNIKAPSDVFEENTIGLQRTEPKGTEYPKDNSAFLNYTFDLSGDEKLKFSQLSVPLEAGVRFRDYLLFSNVSYTRQTSDDNFIRLISQVIRDDRESMRRYTLGDFNASTGELGGGVMLGGFNVSKNYSLNPYFLRYPGVNLSGVVSTTSDVELWVDNMLVSKQRLSPGEFIFQNIPATSGVGEAALVIRDSFGKEERVVIPVYFSSTILKQGLHEYNYSAGIVRENYGSKSDDYAKPALLATHRYGFFENLTAGARLEATERLASSGLSSSFLIKGIGFFDTAVGYSVRDADGSSKEGSAYSLGYSYSRKTWGLNWRLSLRGYSRDYFNISMNEVTAKTEFLSSVGYADRVLGSISLSYAQTNKYDSDDLTKYSARYSRKIIGGLNFDISASRSIQGEDASYEVLSTLRYQFGKTTMGSVGYKNSDSAAEETAMLQKTPDDERGLGYRFLANKADDTPAGYDADISYYAKYGIYTGKYSEANHIGNYQLRTSGSIATVGGEVRMGQPIRDSFAVVKVGDLEGLNVYQGGSASDKTDTQGETLLTKIQSYDANKISIKEEDIPLGYSLASFTKHISPLYRSGSFVRFDIQKLQAISGNIFIIENNKEVPAEFWRLKVKVGEDVMGSPLVQEGEFYLENIPAGKYAASIKKGERQCDFTLEIPESSESNINMGKTICRKMSSGNAVDTDEAAAPAPSPEPAPLPVKKGTAKINVTGKVRISERGIEKPAREWHFSASTKDRVVGMQLDKDGEFYMENILPGKYAATITKDDKRCIFEMKIPDSAETNVNIGALVCAIKPGPAGKRFFAVHVGAFKEKANADEETNLYKKKGYDAFIYKDTLYRVFVGRYADKKDVLAAAREIRIKENKGAYASSIVFKEIYSAQIGAFREKTNADEMTDKYRNKGYDVFIYTNKFHQVMIGRFAEESEASAMAAEIRDKEKIDAFATDIIVQE
ncbi:MAG: fimbria/pilus outer membrane usher protein [Deltaproteobacteria bacterium]|nr:fimbria/pilus outer membrane usher protein [Deltaproteobacteria bacterium]